jgi:hypothetical protein
MTSFIILEGTQGSISTDSVRVQDSNYVNEDWGNTSPEDVAEALGEFSWDVAFYQSVDEDGAFLDYLEEGKFTFEKRFKLINIWWEAYNSAQELSANVM